MLEPIDTHLPPSFLIEIHSMPIPIETFHNLTLAPDIRNIIMSEIYGSDTVYPKGTHPAAVLSNAGTPEED